MLGYTVGLRAASQPLRYNLSTKTAERAKTKRRAGDAQHSVEGENHHTQMSRLSRLSRRSISVQSTKEINAQSNLRRRHQGEKGVFLYNLV